MGSTSYSHENRLSRAVTSGYFSKSADDIFEQNRKRMIHETMEPKTALLRESRDSEVHPNSVPIIFALDVTGSMGKIPHYLVKDGLPNMIQNIINKGVLDPQVLFLGIGDHAYDRHPLQVGQFESGDTEMDLWLTRTYIESGGGSNEGESYLLAWYFAANHTSIDSWEKRQQKGFIFTVGDEPTLSTLPSRVVNELMGTGGQVTYTEKELLEKAQERYNVFHLHVMEGNGGRNSLRHWKTLLGDNCIEVSNHREISNIVAQIVVDNVDESIVVTPEPEVVNHLLKKKDD
jgi:hypothetical protein